MGGVFTFPDSAFAEQTIQELAKVTDRIRRLGQPYRDKEMKRLPF